MTTARSRTVADDPNALYHCSSRCVRRAYLCGFDNVSGKDYSHRKDWIRDRIKFLRGIFCIDIATYAVMCTHLHLFIRVLKEMLSKLSDEEVARRWLMLYPRRRNKDGSPCEPNKEEIRALALNAERICVLRERLGSISWFMKSISEYIARLANREDGCKGRFWEGRFKCQRIDTEAGALSCSIYIDLNPVRAGMVSRPEESLYASVWERAQSISASSRGEPGPMVDDWLMPIESSKERRGLLSMSTEEYLSILDWAGRELKADKRGHIPKELEPILMRLKIKPDGFIKMTQNLGPRFYSVIGDEESLSRAALASGKKWLKGISAARELLFK